MKKSNRPFCLKKFVVPVLPLLFSMVLFSSCTSNGGNGAGQDGQALFIGNDIAIAESVYGRVQGFILRGIYQFRGIPYGADTDVKNRFMPPQEPEPWDDVYPAVWWGNSAPQIMEGRYANPWASFVDHCGTMMQSARIA